MSSYINVGIDPGEGAVVADPGAAYLYRHYGKSLSPCGSDWLVDAVGIISVRTAIIDFADELVYQCGHRPLVFFLGAVSPALTSQVIATAPVLADTGLTNH